MSSPSYVSLVDELAHNLERQAVLVRQTAQTLKEQRMRFVACRGEDLEIAPRALETLATQLVDAEQNRIRVHDRIATHLGVDVGNLRFDQIASTVQGVTRVRLNAARKAATTAADELGIEASIGERLLEWSANCHESMLAQLVGLSGGEACYGPDGMERRKAGDACLIDATL